jgi:hypothetical protein
MAAVALTNLGTAYFFDESYANAFDRYRLAVDEASASARGDRGVQALQMMLVKYVELSEKMDDSAPVIAAFEAGVEFFIKRNDLQRAAGILMLLCNACRATKNFEQTIRSETRLSALNRELSNGREAESLMNVAEAQWNRAQYYDAIDTLRRARDLYAADGDSAEADRLTTYISEVAKSLS